MTSSKISELRKDVAPFEQTNTKASIRQMINTILPLILLWVAAYLSLSISFWLALPFTVAAAGFLIRTFIIFHDCCHQSFFKSRRANDIVGTILGIMAFIPYRQWANTHSIHHATSGNLEGRGVGDMWVMTVKEYQEASFWKRLSYRLYRNPLVMFGLGPTATFLIEYRFNRRDAKKRERYNTYLTNAGIAVLYGGLCWAIGWQAFLLVQGPIFLISGTIGIWLFYVQHQFEETYFEHEDQWSYVKAAVEGSSYYKLPKPLQWITGNIGFHHVHHFSPRVPNYYLEQAHEASMPLQKATTIDIGTSLKSLKYRLWDEEKKQFVTFREAAAANEAEAGNYRRRVVQ